MKIKGDTVIFKSTKDNFDKECRTDGLVKPCTVREIWKVFEINQWIRFYKAWDNGNAESKKIKIVCGDNSFTRTITDITPFREFVIISWNPCEEMMWG